MKKRIVAIVLLFTIIMSSVIAYAAEGDIIHTGLKKMYRADNSADVDELLQDILAGADIDKFYRETKDGKYVNIASEEEKQMKKLEEILTEKGLSDPQDIQDYLIRNKGDLDEKLGEITEGLAIDFTNIEDKNKGNIDDYQGASNAILLDGRHYSTPVPGTEEGTTKIENLNLPDGASKWMIKLSNDRIGPIAKDTKLENAQNYVKGRDIYVHTGKYLVLYAVDNGNRIKGYGNINITDDMIKQPREEAIRLKVGKITSGEKYAGTVVIENLKDKLPKDATKWQVFVSNTAMDKVYKAQVVDGASDYSIGSEIMVADEYELHKIGDAFKKYVLLLATDDEDKTLGYNILEVRKDNISLPPALLEENANYVGPVVGEEDGSTRFTKLESEKNTEWQIKIYNEKPKVPILGSKVDGVAYKAMKDISIKPNQYLMLLATVEEKVEGYRIFKVEESQVKGLTAPKIEDENIRLEKGSQAGTTKVIGLNIDKINGVTKWMYKVGREIMPPILNKVVDESMDYTPEKDIKVTVEDKLLILATDDEGKVKAYILFDELNKNIKDAAPALLIEGRDFTEPVKGSEKGTTKIEKLTPTIAHVDCWRYKISSKPFEVPEIDSMVDGSQILEAKSNIGKDLKGNEYILILAVTDEGNNKYATKGYATFQLSDKQIYMGPAINLRDDDKWKDNYSMPEPGSTPNTTKISTLSTLGLPDGQDISQWQYKILQAEIESPIEMNSKIDRTHRYVAGNNIRVNAGDDLLIIATDKYSYVKAYAIFKIDGKDIRSPNAPLLTLDTNYTNPQPGNTKDSTKFGFLSFVGIDDLDEDEGKWKYRIGDKSFGAIELDSVVDSSEYTVGKDIEDVSPGKYLLLLATDDKDKVKAYREFRLDIDQIRGSEPIKLTSKNNYTIEKGSKPGTTKFSSLSFLGVPKEANNWSCKLIETDEEKKQIEYNIYTNYIVKGTTPYTANRDISVKKINGNEPKYGYILLLATDNRGRTKGYDIVPLDSNVVKEHAEILDVKLIPGENVDTIKIVQKDNAKPLDGNYKVLITKNAYPTPAKGENLKTGDEYKGGDISVFLGEYVTIFEVDEDDNILKFNSLKVEEVSSINATLTALTVSEDRINIGGQKITITLGEGGKWENLSEDKTKRDALYNSFKASNQNIEWEKTISTLIEDGGTMAIEGQTLTFWLPKVEEYDISEEQQITLIIPPSCIKGAKNSVKADGAITIKPIIEATIKGDVVTSTVRQKDIKAGGKNIVIELGDGNWVGDIEDKKNVLFDCFKVIDKYGNMVTEETQWSKVVEKLKASTEPKTIVRNSSKMITITMPKVSEFDLDTKHETIKLTIPKDKGLIIGATSDIVAMPIFTIYPDILQVSGRAVRDTISLMAPDYKMVEENKDTWIIEVESGTLKDSIDNNDVIISGLPRGLKTDISNAQYKNQIEIRISGTASSALTNNTEVKVRIKGTAVKEPNSVDSEDMVFNLIRGGSLIDDLKDVTIDVANNTLKNTSTEMQYSLNSTNGNNGNWFNASDIETQVSEGFGPGRVYVRDKNNHRVFHLVATLNYPKAPTGITIGEVKYAEDSMKIKLDGINVDVFYEYSIDGGNKWNELDVSKPIDFNDDSDLRVRYKATDKSLYSLDAKINVLDLRKVDIDVVRGVITNTTTAMEYSLNGGDTYANARSNETPVKFEDGSALVIRERANRGNKREIGKVGIEEQPTNTSYNIAAGTISATPPKGGNIQYRIGEDPWKDLPTDDEKIEFKPGKVQVRTKATKHNVASEPVNVGDIIKNPAQKPELRTDDYKKDISYWNGHEYIGLDKSMDLEYKINDGNWKDGSNWSTDKENDTVKNTDANISIRFKATTNTLPSQMTIVNFTGNLTFENIELNVVEGKIEGTTTDMEYSITSTDGLNGIWNDTKPSNTAVEFVEGMKVYIREKAKPLNWKLLSDGIKIEEKPDYMDVDYSIADGSITNKTTRVLEYRFDSGKWNAIDRAKNQHYTLYGVEFKPGNLQFRAKGTKDTLPSSAITMDIKARASAPNLKYDAVSYKIEKIGTNEGDGYEYSINDGPWIDGKINTQFEGGDIVKIRRLATEDMLPSQEQRIEFTANLNLDNVILNIGESKLVNTSTLMEYSVVFDKEEDGVWSSCAKDETTLRLMEKAKVYVREKAKPRNRKEVTSEPIKKKLFTDGQTFIEKNIDFNIMQGTISIINPIASEHQKIVDDLQYRINDGNWINVDHIILETNKPKILAYPVNFVKGDLEFRLKGSEYGLPSDSILKATIKAPASVPNVKEGFDIENYRNKVIGSTEDLEYSLVSSTGPWIDGIHLDKESLVGKVYIRTKATKDTLPSLVKELTFTPVLNLKTINLSIHIQPMELNGTTDDMEYNIYLTDGRKTGWKACTNGNTELPEWLENISTVKNIIIQDKNQPNNQYTVWP